MYDELRHLLLIVEHGTFTEAARRAHLSQPALSASVRRLEEAMGARLLHRGRDGARLTAAGEALLPRAHASLAALEDGRRAVSEVMGLQAGQVRMGAGTTATTYLLPPLLASYRQQYPGIRFYLRETTTEEGSQLLQRGTLDLVVVTPLDDTVEPGLMYEPWLVDELILVGAPGRRTRPEPFVSLRPGATSRRLLERWFPEAEIAMELGSLSAVKGSVRAGIGVALISRHAVVDDLRERRLTRLRDPRTPIERPLVLAHRGLHSLPPAVAALRGTLLSEIGRRPPRR